jgi:hypothetical protein
MTCIYENRRLLYLLRISSLYKFLIQWVNRLTVTGAIFKFTNPKLKKSMNESLEFDKFLNHW